MKRDNVNYVVAGAVVVAALVLLFAVLYKITGRSGDTDAYYARYSYVAGLRYGTPVYFEGYRIGQVESITPDRVGSQTRFRIDLSVEAGWPIPADSEAAIATAGLLSDVFIDLKQGESEAMLKPGSEIAGREASDVFKALNNLADDVSSLTESRIEPLLDLLAERVDSITRNIDDSTPALVSDARDLMQQLNASAGSLREILSPQNVGQINDIVTNFRLSSENMASLTTELNAARDDIHSLLEQLDSLVGDNREAVSGVIYEVEASVNLASQRLDSITFNLDEASRNLNEFARSIRRNPNRLLFSPAADDTGEDQ